MAWHKKEKRTKITSGIEMTYNHRIKGQFKMTLCACCQKA